MGGQAHVPHRPQEVEWLGVGSYLSRGATAVASSELSAGRARCSKQPGVGAGFDLAPEHRRDQIGALGEVPADGPPLACVNGTMLRMVPEECSA